MRINSRLFRWVFQMSFLSWEESFQTSLFKRAFEIFSFEMSFFRRWVFVMRLFKWVFSDEFFYGEYFQTNPSICVFSEGSFQMILWDASFQMCLVAWFFSHNSYRLVFFLILSLQMCLLSRVFTDRSFQSCLCRRVFSVLHLQTNLFNRVLQMSPFNESFQSCLYRRVFSVVSF